MTRALNRRMDKLEQAMVVTAETWTGKGHWLVGESREELDAKEASLRASPEWQDGDRIVRWRVVDPKAMRAEQ